MLGRRWFAPDPRRYPIVADLGKQGTMQPAYNHSGNWFSQPPYNTNLKWAQDSQAKQTQKNQQSYPSKGFPLYQNCAYDPKCTPQDVSDWVKGQEPSWAPIAGGKGYSGVVDSSSNLYTVTSNVTGPAVISGPGVSQSPETNSSTPSTGSSTPSTGPSTPSTGPSTPSTGPSTPGTGLSTADASPGIGDDGGDDGVDYCDEL